MKLYMILVGIVLMSLIVSGTLLFLTGGNEEYSPSSFNDTSFQAMADTFSDINSTVKDTSDSMDAASSSNSIQDIFGNLFSQVWGAAKITVQAVGSFNTVVDSGLQDPNLRLGGFGDTVKAVLFTVLAIVFSIGLLMYFVTGRERN